LKRIFANVRVSDHRANLFMEHAVSEKHHRPASASAAARAISVRGPFLARAARAGSIAAWQFDGAARLL